MPYLRHLWIAAVLLLTGCPGPGGLAAGPPRTVEGGWTLANAGDAPVWPGPLSAEKAWIAEYQGPQDVTATFYRYSSATVAFEAMQKRPRTDNELSLHRGNFVVVVDTTRIPKQAAGDFMEGLSKVLH